MKKLTILILFFCFSIIINAQRNPEARNSVKYTISGKIIDKDTKQPLEYATVVLSSVKSKKITGGLSDKNGSFKIEVNEGVYNISVNLSLLKHINFPIKKFRLTLI